MIKIVYFDEPSATDYIIIKNGGVKITTKENTDSANISGNNKTQVSLGGSLSWWPFTKIEASNTTDIDLEGVKKALTKNIVTNVLLTDFIEKADKDTEQIYKFENYKLYSCKTSFAFLGMFMPYLKIIKEDQFPEDLPIDVTKLAEALKDGKKYYEMVAEKIDGDKEKCILRFNIDAFRNNYGISDIVKMNLKYYAIKVGESTEASLNIEEEFKADYEDSTITSLTDNVDEVEDKELLTVYDVVLAGVV